MMLVLCLATEDRLCLTALQKTFQSTYYFQKRLNQWGILACKTDLMQRVRSASQQNGILAMQAVHLSTKPMLCFLVLPIPSLYTQTADHLVR